MLNNHMKTRLARNIHGAALTEYGILVGLVAVVAISSVATLGGKVGDTFEEASAAINLDIASQTPFSCGDTTDIHGQSYGTVQIGSQCWTTENLRYETASSLCMNDSDADCASYGRLYPQADVTQDICGDAFRASTDQDWKELEAGLGMSSGEVDGTGWRESGSVGSQIAAFAENGTNSTGFNGLPGGFRNASGNYELDGRAAVFWSLSDDTTSSIVRVVAHSYTGVNRDVTDGTGYYSSVRCVASAS